MCIIMFFTNMLWKYITEQLKKVSSILLLLFVQRSQIDTPNCCYKNFVVPYWRKTSVIIKQKIKKYPRIRKVNIVPFLAQFPTRIVLFLVICGSFKLEFNRHNKFNVSHSLASCASFNI